jgi:hypothetical protein
LYHLPTLTRKINEKTENTILIIRHAPLAVPKGMQTGRSLNHLQL